MLNRIWMGRLRRTALLLAAALLTGAAALFAADSHVRRSASPYVLEPGQLPAADAVLVLGARVYPSGAVSDILRDRLDTALDIFRQERAPRLLVSGDHGTPEYDEVNAMRRYLLEQGVADEAIFMDHAGFNTYESMYRARDVFEVRRVIIVTQAYHLSRAVYVARQLGLEAYGTASDRTTYRDIRKYEAREVLARAKDWLHVNVLHPRPRYLGKTIPISSDGRATHDEASAAFRRSP